MGRGDRHTIGDLVDICCVLTGREVWRAYLRCQRGEQGWRQRLDTVCNVLVRGFEQGWLLCERADRLVVPRFEDKPETSREPNISAVEPTTEQDTPGKALTWFECTTIDDLGGPVGDISLFFGFAGRQQEYVAVSPSGRARLDGIEARFATVTPVSLAELRRVLGPRWDELRGPSTIAPNEDIVIWRLTDRLAGVELANEQPRTICIRPYVERARLIGGFFERNKCFVLPTGVDAIRGIVKAHQERPYTKMLVVGHTDTTGNPSYNDVLSLERARSMAAYFEENVDAWYEWYGEGIQPEKRWGKAEDLEMIRALPDATQRNPTETAVRWYQRTRGLKVDGICGPKTRHSLIAEYIALNGTSLPTGTVLETHGCGENFPRQPDWASSGPATDNRRVEIFFFDAVLGVQPKPPTSNSRKGSQHYPEWLSRAGEPIDFSADDDEVLVKIEWGHEIVDKLPEDVAIVLTGEGIDPQKHFLGSAERYDGLVRVSFGKLSRGDKITITAKLADKELVLLRDHVASDLGDPFAWEHWIDEWVQV